MPLAEAPAIEDEIVLRHLRQSGVERAPSRGRQNHIVECPAWHDRLDRAATARAKQTREWERRHALHRTACPGLLATAPRGSRCRVCAASRIRKQQATMPAVWRYAASAVAPGWDVLVGVGQQHLERHVTQKGRGRSLVSSGWESQ
jgi:hypothetical protein